MHTELLNIPALSVKQPWAELIISGAKSIELRRWPTSYRGPLWIHTGAAPIEGAMTYFRMHNLFTGGYVGLVELDDVLPLDAVRWEQWRDRHLDPGPYAPGLLGFSLLAPRRLTSPLPAPGALKLFEVPPELASILAKRLPLASS
ncbi:ASCH domain-containing protein [Mesorhizobium sp.]|uniref:ASCH domain-containing protein n=1 Tax=Mesorhizobium sp. TaxID=1871066 RepID=UPI00257D78D7|nr:ASCH domain-containing protein [Mesorhizobium sp.]